MFFCSAVLQAALSPQRQQQFIEALQSWSGNELRPAQ